MPPEAIDDILDDTTQDTLPPDGEPTPIPAPEPKSISQAFNDALSLDDDAAEAVMFRQEVEAQNAARLEAAQSAEAIAKDNSTNAWSELFENLKARAAASPVKGGPFQAILGLLLVVFALTCVGCGYSPGERTIDREVGSLHAKIDAQSNAIGQVVAKIEQCKCNCPCEAASCEDCPQLDGPIDADNHAEAAPEVAPSKPFRPCPEGIPSSFPSTSSHSPSRATFTTVAYRAEQEALYEDTPVQHTPVPYVHPATRPRRPLVLRILGQPQSVPAVTFRGWLLHRVFPPPRSG